MRLLKTLLLSATLALPLAQPIWAGAALVTVTGEATVETVPDMATISLGVTTMGDTAAAAMAANTSALTAVMARLKAAGIDDRDLQTSNLSLNPNWTSDGNGGSKISGYMASNQLSVRVRALDSLGGVLDAVISDGANTLNGISFDVSAPRPEQDAARKAAVEDARARATLLVEAAGGKLGKIVSITEGTGFSGPMPMFRADAAAAPVPISAGQIGMTSSVTISFEIAE